jgi:hypothetical protein
MKTMSSKLRKAGMVTMAIIVVMVATCLTISAQGAKFDNSELNGTTLALAEISKKVNLEEAETEANAALVAFATYLVEENEAELETEDWMLNVDNFFMDLNLEEATETPLKIEDWMTDASYFGMSAYLETATEKTLNLENWMLNVDNFYCDVQVEKATEEPLTTEAWMVNYEIFARK